MKVVTNIKILFSKKRFWAGLLLAQFVLFYVFSNIESIVQLAGLFFQKQKWLHQRLFSFFPFSFGDVLYFLSILFIIWNCISFFRGHEERKKSIKRILLFLNLAYFQYQIFWGLLYFQEPLSNNLSNEKPTIEDAKLLALKYLAICKEKRERVTEDKNGVFKVYDLVKLKYDIVNCQNKIPYLNSNTAPTELVSLKPSLFGDVMSYTGILGYYNPFTAEAQYNPNLPSLNVPFTMAHESAHQLGFAREQEANFVGYLIGKNSPDLTLQYSTDYFVLKSLMNSINADDPKFVNYIFLQFSPKMKKDRLYEKNFRIKHEGVLDLFFGFTNDLFLKSNQQNGSITYSYFTDLLIKYEKSLK